MAKFKATEYARFRVSYPSLLFDKLKSFCGPFSATRPIRVLDLGGGTGFSSRAFLEFFPHAELTLVEPDVAMLVAGRLFFSSDRRICYHQARAEDFEITEPYDLVLVGSAWHWMDRARVQAKLEAARVGCAFIFEYQFPKAIHVGALNDWVRREFNLRWKTEHQVPRGTLVELTQGMRESNFFSESGRVFIPQEVDFEQDAFFGMLISQSRYLAFESTLPVDSRDAYRQSLRAELSKFWGLQNKSSFLLPYEGFVFRGRNL